MTNFSSTEIDFSDIAHGIKVLEEYIADPVRRRAVCELLLKDIEPLDPWANDFRDAIYGCMWFGDPVQRVQDEFTAVLIKSAGWSASQLQIAKARSIASNHGKRGGRPRKDAQGKAWTEEFDARKRRFPMLTSREIYEDIAEPAGKKWTTVRDQISAFRAGK